MRRLYDNYLKYYLNNPEKPHLRIRFIILLIFIALTITFQLIVSKDFTLSIILEELLIITVFLCSYFYGYLGIIAAIPAIIFEMVFNLVGWVSKDSMYDVSQLVLDVNIIIISGFIAQLVERERIKQMKLERLAIIDPITEVYNNKYFLSRLEEEIARATRNEKSVGLIMADIDNFNKFIDLNGHGQGDILLKKTAQVLEQYTRCHDIVCRYSDDQFAVILPDIEAAEMDAVIGRMRTIYMQTTQEGCSSYDGKMTMSMGFSLYPELAKNTDELITQADTALYHAKNRGRDKVQIYKDVFDEIRHSFGTNEQQLLSSLKILLGTISGKDKYTFGHSERVMSYSVQIANAMGLETGKIKILKIAALLHDIGKVEIAESILNKREKLNDYEFAVLRRHPVYSANMLESLSYIDGLVEIVRAHHERYDGEGYPDRLAGTNIPLESRILAVADSYDAMLSNRPYRKGLGIEGAKQELRNCSGTQFDSVIVEAFLKELEVQEESKNTA